MKENEVREKIEELHKLLLSLNAYGSLELQDLKLIENYLKGAFAVDLSDAPGR